jgi:flagellar protein FlaG
VKIAPSLFAHFFLPWIGGKEERTFVFRTKARAQFTWRYIMSVASVGFNIPVSPVTHAQASRVPIPVDAQRTQAARPSDAASEPRQRTQTFGQVGQAFNRKLQFEVDQDSSQVIVKVIDRETDKVIREIPPEELQRMHSSLRDTIGFLFNEFA